MQSGGTSSENSLDEITSSEPALIFDDSHVFDASNGMLDPDPERRNLPVVLLLLGDEFPSPGLLDGLYDQNTGRSVALVPGVLVQDAKMMQSGQPSVCLEDYCKGLRPSDWQRVKVRKTAKGTKIVQAHIVQVWHWDGKEPQACERTLVITCDQ